MGWHNTTAYKQGLNEVAAPFIYITLPPSPAPPAGGGGEEGDVDDDGSGAEAAEAGADGEAEAVALQCFSRFVRVFLRNMYTDEEFKAMQCAFGLFRLLLLYHSPLLSARLDRAGFPPELYLVREKERGSVVGRACVGLGYRQTWPRSSHHLCMYKHARRRPGS